MNFELFIAHRLLKGRKSGTVSVPIVKIAVAGIALGICVMLLSIFVITGFKHEITEKLSGFTYHINITNLEDGDPYFGPHLVVSDSLIRELSQIQGIQQISRYVTKPAILKSKDDIHGVMLRGIDSLYIPSFYISHLVEGDMPDLATNKASNGILLSSSIAGMLNLQVGDKISAHFVQEPPRVRMFTITGIYDTGFKEYDEMVALCDIRHLQRLNDWEENEVTGLGCELENLEEIPIVDTAIDDILSQDECNNYYNMETLYDAAPQIFDWLNLLNMNVVVILVLIIAVAGFNMVSGLLILILDKTAMIGIMKALGTTDISLKKIFFYVAMGLTAKGMLWGNILGFLIGGIQYFFHIIRLDANVYYMDMVPINFDISMVLILNFGVIVISAFMMIVPTILISRIRPIKAIRFE